jgi:CoA:oxalate CoA-transferase
VRPLDGVVVIDLTQFAAGPYCTMLLADAGARVIKIEPVDGEPYRHAGPALEASDGSKTGSYFLRFGRGKESVVLDLKSPKGLQTFTELVKSADVVVQNFRPETVTRLGIDYPSLRALNPRIIYTSISGFGQPDFLPSPYSDWPAFAIVAEAMGGIMDQIGDATCPPHSSGVSLGDLYAGGMAVNGTLMALLQRDRTGEGQHVDIAMVDCMMSLNERSLFRYALTGVSPWRGSPPSWAPFGAFKTSDGWIAIGVIGDSVWKKFCAAIEAPELLTDERLGTGQQRGARGAELITPVIERWLDGRTAKEAAELLNERGVPAAAVFTAKDVVESDHTEARQMLTEVDYGPYGTHRVVASPIKLSGDAVPARARIHQLGEDTDAVLREFAGGAVPAARSAGNGQPKQV